MPKPAQRTRSFRKNKVTTPGGTVKVHYTKKKPGAPKCAACRKPLHGVPRALPSELGKLRKTEKRPDRPYGGNLCPPCTRAKMRMKNMERWGND